MTVKEDILNGNREQNKRESVPESGESRESVREDQKRAKVKVQRRFRTVSEKKNRQIKS